MKEKYLKRINEPETALLEVRRTPKEKVPSVWITYNREQQRRNHLENGVHDKSATYECILAALSSIVGELMSCTEEALSRKIAISLVLL